MPLSLASDFPAGLSDILRADWMDNACAFKPLDFMSALSIALTTDDDRMFTLFARETAEFALSHSDTEKYLWPYHQTVGLANGKDRLGHFGMGQNHGGGFATAAQILQIHRLAGGHSSSLPVLAGLSTFNASLPCPNAEAMLRMVVLRSPPQVPALEPLSCSRIRRSLVKTSAIIYSSSCLLP